MSDKSLESLSYQLISEAAKLAMEQQHGFVRPFHLLQAIVEREDARTFFESFNFPFDNLEDKVKITDPFYTEYPTVKKWKISDDVQELCRSAERHALNNGRSAAGFAEILFFLQEMGDEATVKTIKKIRDSEDRVLRDDYFQMLLKHDVSKYDPLTGIIGEGFIDFDANKVEEKEIDKGVAINFSANLKTRVFGQDEAADAIGRAVKRARAGMQADDEPMGSFLFIGPTGVGKTEEAKQTAKLLDCQLVRIDMSELQNKGSSNRLIGADPGYIGYDDGGLLTNAVKKANEDDEYLVVLLDEIEKAHESVYDVLLQVMDDGRLTDGSGDTVDFKKVILIMTSNVGAAEAEAKADADAKKAAKLPFGFGLGDKTTTENFEDASAESVQMQAVKAKFKPEFRNRLSATVEFGPLDQGIMHDIAQKFIDLMSELKASDKYNLTFSVSDDALNKLAIDGYNPKMGARPLKRLIETEFKDRLTDLILEEDISDANVELDYDDKAGEFKLVQRELQKEPLMLSAPANDDSEEAPQVEHSQQFG